MGKFNLRTNPKPKKGGFKLRPRLTPGRVCIMLQGRFRGARVLMLKALETTTDIVVFGPFAVNGVPALRVNHRDVLATSTLVDLGSLDTTVFDVKYFDKRGGMSKAAFRRSKQKRQSAEDDSIFMTDESKQGSLPQDKKDEQKELGKQVVEKLKAQDPLLVPYLRTKTKIMPGGAPHKLKY